MPVLRTGISVSFLRRRQGKPECGAVSFSLRRNPDSAAVPFYYAFADSQTDARARDLARMQPPENAENALLILRRNPDPVIPDGEEPVVVIALGSDFHLGRNSVRPVFDGVADQVLKDLHQTGAVCGYARHVLADQL